MLSQITSNSGIDRFLDTVYLGDVFDLLKQLPDESVSMVFGDPDYNVGVRYNGRSYTRSFDAYIEWYGRLAKESLRVLKSDGNAFFINYPKQNAYLRVRHLDALAESTGGQVTDYVWVYNTNVGMSPRRFTTAHRSILHATKSKHNAFYKDQAAEPYKNLTDKRIRQNLANGSVGRMPYSWLYADLVKNVSQEKTVHSCQIPIALSEKLIQAATQKGDVVLVLFGGSGAEIALCHQLGRRFISAEMDPTYHQIIQDRLKHNGLVPDEHRMLYAMKSDGQHTESQFTLFEERESLSQG